MIKRFLPLIAAASLCASAQADLQIIMRGSVYYVGPNMPAGFAFENAQMGDPVRLSFTLKTPGQTTTQSNGQLTQFDFDHDRMDLSIGDAAVQSSFLTSYACSVRDQNPGGSDAVYADLYIPGVGGLSASINDNTGLMLNTSDLTQSLGTFSTTGISYLWLLDDKLQGDVQVYLEFMQVVDLGTVGNAYCGPTTLNSTGQPAQLSGYGSSVVAANRLEMQATDLPQDQFAMLLVGSQQSDIANPGNSQGNLCVGGGAIGRFSQQVAFTGAQGTATVEVDLVDMPALFGTVTVVAGETWNYQMWYRDYNPGATTNYTNPVEVVFQ